jgi:hypothetical protein
VAVQRIEQRESGANRNSELQTTRELRNGR